MLLAVLDSFAEVVEVADLWQFVSVHLVEVVDELGIAHHGQRLAQTLGLVGHAHLPQFLVESLHGDLGHAL